MGKLRLSTFLIHEMFLEDIKGEQTKINFHVVPKHTGKNVPMQVISIPATDTYLQFQTTTTVIRTKLSHYFCFHCLFLKKKKRLHSPL